LFWLSLCNRAFVAMVCVMFQLVLCDLVVTLVL
jgi:hypothetical protein